MIKAIFFDVDGTLLSFKTHEVPESTRKAFELLRKTDIKLFVSTGRTPLGFKKVEDRLGLDFDGHIYSNGQYVVVDDKVIHDMFLPKEDLKNLVSYIEEKQIATTFSELDYTYHNLANDRMRELMKFVGGTTPKFNFDNPRRVEKHKTYQISPYILKEEEEEFFSYAPNLRGVRWNKLFVDVIPKEGGKGTGIKKLIEYLGIKREETMAFGDGGNDADMLAFVGHGIAMGNAHEDAIKVSDYVTDHVDEDGLYKALVKYGVIGEL